MEDKEIIKELGRKIDEMSEKIRLISERQNSQYTDIMLRLKETRDEIQERNTEEEDNRSTEELYEDVLENIIEQGKVSTSYIQRMEGIGYARACMIMDMLEERGVIGVGNGAKPREVLIKPKEE